MLCLKEFSLDRQNYESFEITAWRMNGVSQRSSFQSLLFFWFPGEAREAFGWKARMTCWPKVEKQSYGCLQWKRVVSGMFWSFFLLSVYKFIIIIIQGFISSWQFCRCSGCPLKAMTACKSGFVQTQVHWLHASYVNCSGSFFPILCCFMTLERFLHASKACESFNFVFYILCWLLLWIIMSIFEQNVLNQALRYC